MCVELKKSHFANGIESKWTRAHKSENETEKNASTIKRVGMQSLVQSGHCLAIQLLRYTQFMSLILLEYASFGTSWCLSIGFNCPIKLLHCMCGMVERRTTHSRLSLSLLRCQCVCWPSANGPIAEAWCSRTEKSNLHAHTHPKSKQWQKAGPNPSKQNKANTQHTSIRMFMFLRHVQ